MARSTHLDGDSISHWSCVGLFCSGGRQSLPFRENCTTLLLQLIDDVKTTKVVFNKIQELVEWHLLNVSVIHCHRWYDQL